MSAKFDPITKRLQRLSLVTHPVISDTELHAAFACACEQEHPIHEFSEDHPPMNDRTKAALAKLDAMDETEREGVLSAILDDDIADIDDVAEHDDFDDEVDVDAVAADQTPAEFALRAQVDALLAKDREREAERFADSVIGTFALPTEKPHLMAQHAQAARDDAAGVAEFAAGKHKSRVAAFEAGVRARPKLGLLGEEVASFANGRHVLSNGADAPDPKAPMSVELLAKYLSATPEGKAALAAVAVAAK